MNAPFDSAPIHTLPRGARFRVVGCALSGRVIKHSPAASLVECSEEARDVTFRDSSGQRHEVRIEAKRRVTISRNTVVERIRR